MSDLMQTKVNISPAIAAAAGVRRLWDADLAGAEALLRSALVGVGPVDSRIVAITGQTAAQAYGGIALIRAVHGDVQSAEAYAMRSAQAYAGADYAGFACALARWLAGGTADPRPAFVDSEPFGALKFAMGRTMLAETHLKHHRPAEALVLLADVADEAAAPLAGRALAVCGRAYLECGEPARALRTIEPVHRMTAAGPWARSEAWLAEALACEALGRSGAADVAVVEALAAAGPQLVRPFIAAGPAAAQLLGRRPHLTAAYPRLLAALDLDAESSGPPLRERITERESVILRFLPSLLTTTDIAAELCLSPNTVKTHIRSIYRKLEVGCRRDAVRRARELGLMRE